MSFGSGVVRNKKKGKRERSQKYEGGPGFMKLYIELITFFIE